MVTVRGFPSKIVFGMIGSEGIYHTSSTSLAGSGGGASVRPVYVVDTGVQYPALPFGEVDTSSQYVSLRVRQRDRHTDKRTGSSFNQGSGPRPCCGGSGDYMLWSARGPYWGTCRATVNPRFQIKVTGRVKLQNPSPFLSFPGWKFLFDIHKKSLRTALSVCTIYDNTFSPCFHFTSEFSAILSWTLVNVTHSTSIQGWASSVCQSTTQNVFIGRLEVWEWAGEG